eukprot:TRINITY_DN96_c0_g1_i2.p1 TRINITY_DN96_c0_g1~~TRINITY_DN96_c0_g1_i2.p1  ORF type:complete len:237 (+),score=95.86 TRINITY_DN96_c0_g1_i2:291-1001(+)
MASSLVTQVSRDGTAARAPAPERPSLFKRLCCCGGSAPPPAPAQSFRDRNGQSEVEGLLPPIAPNLAGRKCLVLDLDETLVHSSFKPVPNADYIIPVEIEDTVHQVYVLKRPGVDEFMRRMGPLFEVVIFTASVAKYADPVLDLLDIHKVCHHRLFREACVCHRGNYVKDLGKIGRPLKDIIIIDNSPASYLFNPENAVPIDSWFDDPNDTELLDLIAFLEDIANVDDVCSVLSPQ